MNGTLGRLAARLVRLTHIVDRTYQRFDQLRSLLVLAFASESFLEVYSKLAYGAASTYRVGTKDSREGLFPWEERAITTHFPAPPARLLIGAAGGGREAFALAARGYKVLAFEPAPPLAASMRVSAQKLGMVQVEAYRASYADLPIVHRLAGAAESGTVDLSAAEPFDGAILGWTSFSHLTTDAARREALIRCAALTRGPILVSYFLQGGPPGTGTRALEGLRRRAARWGTSVFTVGMGYSRLLTERELVEIVAAAGLEIVAIDRDSTWPNAVLRAGGAGGAGKAGGAGRADRAN